MHVLNLYNTKNKNLMYQIQNRETGAALDECCTLEDAIATIAIWEHDDKIEGIYVDNFYEIKDLETNEIL